MPTLQRPRPGDICVILVRPRYAENVGAIARALENAGAGALRLVAPNAITLDGIAQRVARGGEARLQSAKTYGSLADALHGLDLTVATSHKMGKRRRPLTPWELSGGLLPKLRPRTVGLVMGPEDHGLAKDEIDLCHRLVTIPSDGPLNLAQAVVVLLYELCMRPAVPPEQSTSRQNSPTGAVPRIVAGAERALRNVGYPHHRKPMQQEMSKLADILTRAHPDALETNFLIGLFRHIERFTRG